MRGRGVGAAVLAALLGVGCGGRAEEARTPPEEVTEPIPQPGAPADVLEPPPSAPSEMPPPPVVPPEDTGPRADEPPPPLPVPPPSKPDASTLTFEVPACVPLEQPFLGPRSASPCEVRTLRPGGELFQRERFDADGHPLEETTYAADGSVSYHTVHTWKDGNEVRRVSTSASGPSWTREWSHDAQGRLVWEWQRHEPTGTLTESRRFYDALGRLARMELREGGKAKVRLFTYDDATGWLDFVTWQTEGEGSLVVERYTYHPNSQPRTYTARPPTMGGAEDREYDEAGRLVLRRYDTGSLGGTERREYNAHGELARRHDDWSSAWAGGEADRLYVYDSEQHLVVDALVSRTSDYSGGGRPYEARQVRRFFHACVTGELLREELDMNADGTPDGWRELERDAAGNLVAERFSGTAANSELGRREYDYVCH